MIVRLQGRLCNQMFEYAFAKSVAKARNEDVTFYSDQHAHLLAPFNVDIRFEHDVSKLALKFGERNLKFDPEVYAVQKGLFFEGYWQNERYFDSELVRDHLRFKNPPTNRDQVKKLADEIYKTESCFIHVRRGDYLKEPHASFHGVLGMDYYNAAINYVRERKQNVKFFVFSDDTGWCKQHLKDHEVIENTNSYEDFMLASFCKNSIIANSSFSWWSGWIHEYPGKIIVAPKQWFKSTQVDYSEIVPDRWIKL